MYCERCGKKIDNSLNFCNGCGTQLKKEKEKDESKSLIGSLISAIIAVSVVGLGVLVGLVAILLDKITNYGAVLTFALIYLATLFGICFLLIRQLSKVIDRRLDIEPKGRTKQSQYEERQPLVQLPPKSTNPLEDFNGPASVTEHTTRTLDEVPVERR